MEKLYPHLHMNRCDVQGHVTSALQVKMAYCVWTEEDTEYFLQVFKEKNIATILDGKQM